MTSVDTRPPAAPRAPGTQPPRRVPVARRPAARSGLAEAALASLTLAAAVDLARLFKSMGPFLGPVALVAIAVHAVAWGCRRRGLGVGVSAVVSAWVGALVLAWTVLPHHTLYGLPTRDTLTAARSALSVAMDKFRTVSPPAPGEAGFVLAGGIGCAAAAFLADWAAFRMQATTEACLPSLSLFVFSSALAQGHRTTLAVAVWLAALLTFLLMRESGLERPGTAWFASRSGQGPAAIVQTGALLAAAAIVVAVTIGPHLPGATTHPAVNWRNQSLTGPGRTTGSPLVDIRSRILDESNVEVFTVSTNTPAYWRLTSLDHFDGSGWSLNDTYHHPSGTLAQPEPGGLAVNAKFSITDLQSIWLPAAFRPVKYSGPGKVSYSPDADSLIADKATSDGMTYQVQSSIPALDPAALRASPPVTDPALAPDLALPPLPSLVRATALRVTAGARTPYDAALMLQNWFRSQFTYDLNVAPDDSDNAIVLFLEKRRGFCQQFAGTYAVMARLLGLPARVAVGFTPGEAGTDGLLHVLDAQAHAWPEVWFAGFGWVPFEPTPGRGAPGEQSYTGVPPQQATAAGGTTTPSSASTPTTAPGGATATTQPKRKVPNDNALAGGKGAHHRSPLRTAGDVALWCSPLLLLGITPLVTGLRRARRRAAATTPAARVLLAWREAKDDLAVVGAPARRSDTPDEYAERATRRASLPAEAEAALRSLAGSVVEVSYAPVTASPHDAREAEESRAVIATTVIARRPRWQRWASALDPRSLRS